MRVHKSNNQINADDFTDELSDEALDRARVSLWCSDAKVCAVNPALPSDGSGASISA